jgi:hypothetical protein
MKETTASFHALVSRIEHLAMNETPAIHCLSPSEALRKGSVVCHTTEFTLVMLWSFYGLTNDPSICRTFIQPGSVGGYGIGYFLAISSSRSIPSPGLSLP